MTTDYPEKILNYSPEGRRNIGRPQTRWEDDFGKEGITQSLTADDNVNLKIISYGDKGTEKPQSSP